MILIFWHQKVWDSTFFQLSQRSVLNLHHMPIKITVDSTCVSSEDQKISFKATHLSSKYPYDLIIQDNYCSQKSSSRKRFCERLLINSTFVTRFPK